MKITKKILVFLTYSDIDTNNIWGPFEVPCPRHHLDSEERITCLHGQLQGKPPTTQATAPPPLQASLSKAVTSPSPQCGENEPRAHCTRSPAEVEISGEVSFMGQLGQSALLSGGLSWSGKNRESPW